jgi:hypothetical protein
MIVTFANGRQEYFGQTSHDGGKEIKVTECPTPVDSLLTGMMKIGSHLKGGNARLGYIRFDIVRPGGGGWQRCEPVAASKTLLQRSYYVERRMISGVIASGLNPLLHVGGLTEFTFTFWKRVVGAKLLGAAGADKIDLNSLGEPDIPTPDNEYYHNYCNSDTRPMTFGETSYDTSQSDSTSLCTERTRGSTFAWNIYLGLGFATKISTCAGIGVEACTDTLDIEFMVKLTTSSSTTTEESRSRCETRTSKASSSLVMPGIDLSGQESTEYRLTLFRKKLTDITVQVQKQLIFEDGTNTLMPPEDVQLKGVIVLGSMATFTRQVKNMTKGCSYILEPAVPGAQPSTAAASK